MSEKARLKVYADWVEPLLAGDGNALLNLASEYPFRREMLLTAHDAEEGILLGLDAGADDYLSKRVSGAQLIARLSAATRVSSLEHSLKSALEDRRQLAMVGLTPKVSAIPAVALSTFLLQPMGNICT